MFKLVYYAFISHMQAKQWSRITAVKIYYAKYVETKNISLVAN